MNSLSLITPPQTEPVSLDEAKLFLAIDEEDDSYDDLITSLVKASRTYCERYTGLCLITQTWSYWLDSIPVAKSQNHQWWDGVRQGSILELMGRPEPILLPKKPVQSIQKITTYGLDNNGTLFNLSGLNRINNQISLNYGYAWPQRLRPSHAINIEFVAGYGDDPETVPADLAHAVKLMLAHLFEHREAAVETALHEAPLSAKAILNSYKELRI